MRNLLGSEASADGAVQRIGAMQLAPSTKMQYIKAAEAIFPAMKDTSALRLFKRAIAKECAAAPIRQAKPICAHQVVTVIMEVDYMTAMAVAIAYKTAARWSEVCSLRVKDFIYSSPERVIINWRNLPKASQLDPHRPDMFAVIEGNFTPLVHHGIAKMRDGAPLCRTTVRQINALLGKILGPEYSSHSLKRGAVTTAMESVQSGLITIEDVARLAKHQDINTTIRYAGNLTSLALALGTQKVTRML